MLANDWRNYEMMGDYISHHGILGMKWGIRRFQNPDGTRTPAGKARYNESGEKSEKNPIQKIGDAIKKHKADKQRKAALEKARQAKATKAAEAKSAEEREAERKKALESGDYKQIQKYANESSTTELKSALERADTLARLDQNVAKNTPKEKTVWDKIDDVANKVGTATNAFNKGKDAWNAFAKAWNTFADEDSMLPELGTNFAEQKEKRRKEKEESARKEKVERISKTVDPEKIMKNQALFTDSELKSAKERVGNYEDLKLQKQLREEGADSVNKNGKKKNDSSSDSDVNPKSAKELNEMLKDLTEKEKQQKRDRDHEKWKSEFEESKKRMQEELDEAVKRSQRSVYSQPISSAKGVKGQKWGENSAKAQQAVDDIWEVINNPKSNNASNSNWNGLYLTSIWDID